MSELNALFFASGRTPNRRHSPAAVRPDALQDIQHRWRLSGSPSTVQQYAAALARFEAFCRANDLIAQPAVPATVAAFLWHRRTIGKVLQASLDADARAIRQGHLGCGLPDPTDDPAVREALGRKRGVGSSLPLVLPDSPDQDMVQAIAQLAPRMPAVPSDGSELTLDDLDPIVERVQLEALAGATRRAYAHALRAFAGFCRRHGLSALPAEPRTVCRFLVEYGLDRKPPTVATARAAIRWVHRHAKLASPTDDPSVEDVIKGHARAVGTRPKEKYAVSTDDVVAMCRAMEQHGGIGAIRDRAILLLGFAGAFRRSEMTCRNKYDGEDPIYLDRENLTFSRFGVQVLVKKSKTDQEGAGREVFISYGQNKETCAVLALQSWLEIMKQRGIESGPVFRRLRAKGDRLHGDATICDTPLTAAGMVERLKYWAAKIGLDPATIGGHSLRSGHVTTAAQRGASIFSIAQQGGWRNLSTLRRYYRRATAHKDTSSNALGL